MGGGSSDAASTLMALNRLWQLNLTRRELQRIGLGLGADVPFFLCGSSAWVEGIGEHITPLEHSHALPPQRFVVVKPEAGLETLSIFRAPTSSAIMPMLQSLTLLQITMALARTTCSPSPKGCSLK